MTIINRTVRWYQQPFHKYLVSTPRARAIEIAHRRWGKDEVSLIATAQLAEQRQGSYWHCLPEYEQGRKALWTMVDPVTGVRRIDQAFPPETRANTDEQSMFIRFKNGSTWQIVGSDRYNNLVGAGVTGVVFSEWALANPAAWGFIRPMIEENNGWAAFITTPRGRNHAHAMYERALKSRDWFAECSTITETGALTKAQQDEALADYVTMFQSEDIGAAMFRQEYLCDFQAAVLGAFYAKEMAAVRASGRVALFKAVDQPVHRAWDIGMRDDTSIWWFQVVDGVPVILDCFTSNGAYLEEYVDLIHEKADEHGWEPGRDFVPHDAKVREWGGGRTRLEAMRAFGLDPVLTISSSKLDGINAVRMTLATAIFHGRCEMGMQALEQYRREWDEDRKVFKPNEYRDWTTHLADAFRILALAWRSEPKPKPKRDTRTNKSQVLLPGAPAEPPFGAPSRILI